MTEFPNYASLWKQVSSPGDAAVVLVAGTVGFLADAALNLVGFCSPGVVGATTAAAALGVKKSYEAERAVRRARREERFALHRAAVAMTFLNQRYPQGRERLRFDVALRQAGVIDDEQLSRCVDEVIDAYRSCLSAR
jgi:hypothetical protein